MTGNRSRFRPEAIPTAIPPSERGHLEIAPEPDRPGQFRLWLYGDGSRGKPRSILLTRRDVRGLAMWAGRLAETPDVPQQGHPAVTPQTGPATAQTGQPQAWWRPRAPSPPQQPGPA
jgi:hypothetical protein